MSHADVAPPAPEQPAYDQAEYQAELDSRVHAALRSALNATEPALHSELVHIGSVLDGLIADTQSRLAAAEQAGDSEGAVQAAWDSFALLRKRHAFGVPTAPQPLCVQAAPLREDMAALFEAQAA